MKELHVIFICDCSSSMGRHGKIQSLNEVARQTILELRDIAAWHEHIQVLVRVATFSDGAQWLVHTPTPVEEFRWPDLEARGCHDMGSALKLVAEGLRLPLEEKRALNPVLFLITDGQPTDDFDAGLKALLAEPWGRKARRIAVAIGAGADYETLRAFTANQMSIPVLTAANFSEWINYVRWDDGGIVPPPTDTPPLVEANDDEVHHDWGKDTVWGGDADRKPNVPIPTDVETVDAGDEEDVW